MRKTSVLKSIKIIDYVKKQLEIQKIKEDINKLIVVLESAERKERKTFKLNLMDIEEETYDISPIQFPFYPTS